EANHNIYVIKNGELIGWVDMQDDIREEAKTIVNSLHQMGIKTVLLSGDKLDKCQQVAQQLGIDEVIAEQTPEQKLAKIAELNSIA
ncbi:HAD family hydrolase, partial [Klebsiella pneumoniae]|uniref:HAD family hydrolase n=1 Tax=Klebsiella pneumoniae TaxID=573 RepID=UPI00272F7268